MADSGSSFSDHAAPVIFPLSRGDLRSVTKCPACFTALTVTICGNCGLDLNHPDAGNLAAASASAADLLDERIEIIGRMRFETAQALEEARVRALAAREAETVAAHAAYEKKLADAAAAAPTTVSAPAAIAPVAPVVPSTIPAFPTATAPPTAAPRRRGSSIQVLLLISGVSLVSLAAALFVIYAFVNFGIEWRSAIIASITVASFTVASLLRRRNYAATAEGIAVFAVVLVYLDAYAVRANNLFDSDSSNPQVYWGVTLLGSALGFILWHRLSALRVASVAGFAAVAPGAALLVYGLSESLEQPLRLFLSFAAMAAAGLLHPLAARRARGDTPGSAGLAERTAVLGIAAIGIVVAFGAAFFIDISFWSATTALGGVAVIGTAHALLSLAPGSVALRTVTAFGRGFAVVGAVAAGSAFVPTLLHNPEPAFAAIAPVGLAVLVTLGLDTLWRRLGSPAAVGLAGPAAIAALVVASAAAVVPLVTSVRLTVETVAAATGYRSWSRDLADPLGDLTVESSSAVAAAAVIAVLAIGFSAASGTLRQRRVPLVAIAGAVAVFAVPLLVATWAIALGWLAIGAVALVLVIFGARRVQLGTTVRITLAAAAIAATSLGYLAAWASVDTWLAGSIATIALVLAARLAFPPAQLSVRAVSLFVATLLGITASIALAQQLTLETRGFADFSNSVRFVNILAIALLVLCSAPRAIGLAATDRRTLFWISFPTVVVTSFIVWAVGDADDLILPEFGTSLAVSSVLLIALLVWIVLRGNAALQFERIAASIALAPAGFLVVDALARIVDLPGLAHISSVTSALLVAAGALAVSILRPSGAPRWAREVGIALVVVPAVFLAVSSSHDQTWIVLLLAGVTMLLMAISADGLFGSGSARKHFGWVALALGTAGLWWRLSSGTGDGVDSVEPFSLPLAGALLVIAVLIGRAQRSQAAESVHLAAPLVAFGGLLVAVLPIAVAASTGQPTRAIVIGAVSALLLLGGSYILGGRLSQPYLDAAAATGALGLLTVTIGRIAVSIPLTDLRVDAWLGGAFVVLFAAAVGQSRHRDPNRMRSVVSQGLAATAITTALVLQLFALSRVGDSFVDLSQLRVLIWAIVFAAIAITALTMNRGPLRSMVGWIAVGAVGTLVFASIIQNALTILQASGLLVIIALCSSATALIVTLLGASTERRIDREIGLATLALLALVILPGDRSDAAWLVLEVAAVVALLVSISADGLFGARSPRKHVGWLALALAVAGMWWRLSGSDVRNVEPYVLPLAGALLLIALLVWRSRRAQSDGVNASPVIVLGALLIAILPLGLNGASGAVERPIAVGLVSAALLLVGSLATSDRLRPYLDAAAAAGAVGVIVVAVGKSWFISAAPGTPDASLDAWLAAALIALLVAAFGQSRPRVDDTVALRSGIAQALGILGLVVVLVFEASAVDGSSVGFIRALGTVFLFSAVHVISVAIDVSPFTRLVAWSAFVLAVIASIVGFSSSAFDHIEFSSVPLALALIAGGLLHLQRESGARGWLHLGPGLLLLVVPSLLVAIDDRPTWRIAAIAVIAIAITVAGLLRRLQAPFIIGALVTIIHTITTFSPQLRELYEVSSWLVWIVIGTVGGTLLIVLAARFEKSLNTARSTLRRVGELR